MEGVFVAVSEPGLNIEPDAWVKLKRGTAYGSAFPAQVRVRKLGAWPPAEKPCWQHGVSWTSKKDFEQALTQEQAALLLKSVCPLY